MSNQDMVSHCWQNFIPTHSFIKAIDWATTFSQLRSGRLIVELTSDQNSSSARNIFHCLSGICVELGVSLARRGKVTARGL